MPLVGIDVSEEFIASIIRVKRINELGTLIVTSILQLLSTANDVPSSLILFTFMMEAIVPPKHRFLQDPQGVIYKMTAFFIVLLSHFLIIFSDDSFPHTHTHTHTHTQLG
jgi:hypothetical protein